MRLHWLLILNVAVGNGIAVVLNLNATKEPLTLKDIDFVEVIKKDLRRNNDDYADALYDIRNRTDASPSESSVTVPKTELTTEPNDLNTVKGVRRDYNDLGDNNYDSLLQPRDIKANATQAKESSVRAFMKKINRMVPTYKLASLTRNITTSTKPTHHWKMKTHSKHSILTLKTIPKRKLTLPSIVSSTTKSISEHNKTRNKMEKFKDFMKKNKGLFKNFMSSKLELTQTNRMSPVTRHAMSSMKSIYGYRAKVAERARAQNIATLPDTELLDMAPAKGARISHKRLKGRLCHRHVLMPEGPKYDSRGRWYLAAHALMARRPYERTRRPTLLLPRCCNCCKKSVLGCE